VIITVFWRTVYYFNVVVCFYCFSKEVAAALRSKDLSKYLLIENIDLNQHFSMATKKNDKKIL